jgi:hypothetical protein
MELQFYNIVETHNFASLIANFIAQNDGYISLNTLNVPNVTLGYLTEL